jgi:hypothetical protein
MTHNGLTTVPVRGGFLGSILDEFHDDPARRDSASKQPPPTFYACYKSPVRKALPDALTEVEVASSCESLISVNVDDDLPAVVFSLVRRLGYELNRTL